MGKKRKGTKGTRRRGWWGIAGLVAIGVLASASDMVTVGNAVSSAHFNLPWSVVYGYGLAALSGATVVLLGPPLWRWWGSLRDQRLRVAEFDQLLKDSRQDDRSMISALLADGPKGTVTICVRNEKFTYRKLWQSVHVVDWYEDENHVAFIRCRIRRPFRRSAVRALKRWEESGWVDPPKAQQSPPAPKRGRRFRFPWRG